MSNQRKRKPATKSKNSGRKPAVKGRAASTKARPPRNLLEIYLLILAMLAVLVSLSVYGDLAGPVGRGLDKALGFAVGDVRFLIPPLILVLAVLLALVFRARQPRGKGAESKFRAGPIELWGLLILVMGLAALMHMPKPLQDMFSSDALRSGGGILGACIAWPLTKLLHRAGGYTVVITMVAVGFLMLTGVTAMQLVSIARRKPREEPARQPAVKTPAVAAPLRREEKGEPAIEIHGVEQTTAATGRPSELTALPVEPIEPTEQLKLKMEKAASTKKYLLPPLSLLRKTELAAHFSKKSINDLIRVVEKTLEDFDVDAAVTRVTRGPTVTRFEVELGSGVKVGRILNLADDIAYALASPDVRIIAPIPGKSAVGIEVPNRERDLVSLGDVLDTEEARKTQSPLRVGLGKDVTGKPVVLSLAEMPHLLLAGATGSGKSCSINSMVASVLFSARPDQVKLIMIDPKYVELSHFNGIPHLLTPVINDPKKAAGALQWAVREMEQRYKILSLAGQKNIDGYNQEVENGLSSEVDEKGRRLFEPLPYILVVIDELADLMMVSPAEVEDSIARIAQMARAVGMHLLVATQRPSVDVVTGLIKANIPSRIAFAVASQADSRVILDTGGADKLVGHGDMLYLPAGSAKPLRVQGAYISEKEIEPAVAFIKRQAEPDYNSEIVDEARSVSGASLKSDELLDQAMELVVLGGVASASLLQRKLRVGYARAARLIDLLEDRGIVGGYEGSKPRNVLVTPEELEEMRKRRANN